MKFNECAEPIQRQLVINHLDCNIHTKFNLYNKKKDVFKLINLLSTANYSTLRGTISARFKSKIDMFINSITHESENEFANDKRRKPPVFE